MHNANGQNLRANNDRVEGTVNYQINTQARIILAPPADAIQVVDVTTNAYDAEHGQSTGAIVNVVLKSGTNQIHGSAFEYNVNSALKAKNALSALPPTPANMNQFGFTVGGPIRKNRTFIFGDYQGSLNHLPSNALLSVPTDDYRAGNFSSASTILYDPNTGTATRSPITPFPRLASTWLPTMFSSCGPIPISRGASATTRWRAAPSRTAMRSTSRSTTTSAIAHRPSPVTATSRPPRPKWRRSATWAGRRTTGPPTPPSPLAATSASPST